MSSVRPIYNEDGFTLKDLRSAENLLDIQIKIICAENFNTVIYEGAEKNIIVYLYKQWNHFDLINSMTFFGSSYFGNKCNKPLSDRHESCFCLLEEVFCVFILSPFSASSLCSSSTLLVFHILISHPVLFSFSSSRNTFQFCLTLLFFLRFSSSILWFPFTFSTPFPYFIFFTFILFLYLITFPTLSSSIFQEVVSCIVRRNFGKPVKNRSGYTALMRYRTRCNNFFEPHQFMHNLIDYFMGNPGE